MPFPKGRKIKGSIILNVPKGVKDPAQAAFNKRLYNYLKQQHEQLYRELFATSEESTGFYSDMQGPTGFPTLENCELEWDNISRTLTVIPDSELTGYSIYIEGYKYTIKSNKSVTIDNEIGYHYIYFNNGTTLSSSYTDTYTGAFDSTHCMVCIIYWNGTDGVSVTEERHGCVMDLVTHLYCHETRGPVYYEGFDASLYVLGADTDQSLKFDLSNGKFWNEDIKIQVTNST